LIIGVSESEVKEFVPGLAGAGNVYCTGYIPPEEVSRWFQSSDLFLAPFLDGMTTRRTSAISAMAHGLPVVTTRGPLFDAPVFEQSPLVITDCDTHQFSEAVLRLMKNEALRREIGAATALFFERLFRWSVIANRLLSCEGDQPTFSAPSTSPQ
jgi:glycosyltransferase involved in cell wall biosynthesis